LILALNHRPHQLYLQGHLPLALLRRTIQGAIQSPQLHLYPQRTLRRVPTSKKLLYVESSSPAQGSVQFSTDAAILTQSVLFLLNLLLMYRWRGSNKACRSLGHLIFSWTGTDDLRFTLIPFFRIHLTSIISKKCFFTSSDIIF
jgi:hypothetical protein